MSAVDNVLSDVSVLYAVQAGIELERARLMKLLTDAGVIWRAGEDSRRDDSGVWRAGDWLFIAGLHRNGYLILEPLEGLEK